MPERPTVEILKGIETRGLEKLSLMESVNGPFKNLGHFTQHLISRIEARARAIKRGMRSSHHVVSIGGLLGSGKTYTAEILKDTLDAALERIAIQTGIQMVTREAKWDYTDRALLEAGQIISPEAAPYSESELQKVNKAHEEEIKRLLTEEGPYRIIIDDGLRIWPYH